VSAMSSTKSSPERNAMTTENASRTALEHDGRLYNELAAYARERSGADGVIVVFVKGPTAQLAHAVSPELLGCIPTILEAASRDSLHYLRALAKEIDRTATGELRRKIDEEIRKGQTRSN
jgi:hypothetical protein